VTSAAVRKHAGFVVASCLLVATYSQVRGDPGVLALAPDRGALLAAAEMGNDLPSERICPTCVIRRPYRSKHSWPEDRCIARFDHHCAWLNRSIGADNGPAFFLFLISHGFLLMLINLCLFQHLSDSARWSILDWVLAYVLALSCAGGLFLAWMGWTTLFNAGCNLTVNEQANHHRAPYSEYCTMVPGEGLATQFDYGFFYNLFDFFDSSRRRLWHSAHTLDAIPPVTAGLVLARCLGRSVGPTPGPRTHPHGTDR